ncbi:arginine transporter permease subunit ArtQ, partial [Salmonella enterica subsp. enterica serovar Heidelberg str. RI-11-013343]
MTVGLAVCALIIGLALAMFFAVWESVKWRPIAWIGSALVTILRGLPEFWWCCLSISAPRNSCLRYLT